MAFINDPPSVPGPTATGPKRFVSPVAVTSPPVFRRGAATPPAGTPPPGDINVGGTPTDYDALIKSDPGLIASEAAGARQRAEAAAQRQAALRRLAIQYGGLPAGFSDQFGDLDSGTLDMAGKNQFSQKAVIERNYAQGVEGFKRALAARGVLQSGELGYGLDQADLARGQQEYDAGNQFSDQFQAAINGYAGTVNDTYSSEAAAIAAAEGNVYNNPANRPVGASTAHLEDGSVEKYGFPVYTDPTSGKRYKVDGSEFIDSGGSSTPSNVPASAGFSGFDSNGNWIG